MTDRLAVTVFVAESRIPRRIRDSLISICRAGASLNTMMLARRLASRARSVRLFSSPSQHKGRILQTVGRVTLVSIIAGLFFSCRVSHSLIFLTATGTLYYVSHKERHPGPQLPFDPEKKTVVVLGSGWGATSLLKHLDTEDYNTVRLASVL